MAIEDYDWNKIRKCRSPNRNNVRAHLPGRNGDIDSKADEPIGPNGAQKYLHPDRCQHLWCCKIDNVCAISGIIENPSV